MPPTKATRPSITMIFSWWQWVKPVHPSACATIFVWCDSASSISRTSRCDGLKSGSGAPFHESTRTSTRSASSASRLRTTIGSSSREMCSSGEKNQPPRWMYDSARASSSAMAGSASEPSTSIWSALPFRGGKVPFANASSDASSACAQPTRRSRPRWRLRTASSMRSPNSRPILTVADSRNFGALSLLATASAGRGVRPVAVLSSGRSDTT